jgi:penicillin-binding protein 1C
LGYYLNHARGAVTQTSIDASMQEFANQTVERHGRMLAQNQIFNAAAIVVNNRTAKVMAYVGNTSEYQGRDHQNQVDIIRSARSTGSILKPFLYAAALQDGLIAPSSLMPDIPTYYSDFSPQNYQRSFDGAVRANEALSRSLNIPAVRLLNDYGCDRFLILLQKAGFTTFKKSADHYGLSLILGGGEARLWELANAYSAMARILNNYETNHFGYSSHETLPISLLADTLVGTSAPVNKYPTLFSAAACWFTFEALTQVHRPPEEEGWETFAGSRRIAWKTGTSFGYRDAWAVGVTPDYTVAVWVGNAAGEGRPGIMGGTAAAPIMFDIYRRLPPTSWFKEPFEDLLPAQICRQTGFVASPFCNDSDTLMVPAIEAPLPVCPYHKRIHLDAKGMYRVTEACCDVGQMVHENRFVLPPLMESYYKFKNAMYEPLPPFMAGCVDDSERPMEFIYPQPGMALFVPKGLDGSVQRVVLRVAHRNASARLFWHVNDRYVGETQTFHSMEVLFEPGWHTITVVDDQGFKMQRRVQCVNKQS